MRLLIADDRERTRRAVRALLAAHPGFEVVGEASDGQQAIHQVEQLAPDLVILDLRMPRLDGIAATAEIKRRWPRVRVVVHSLAVDRRDDALAAGADAFVAKAGQPDELLEALHPDWPCQRQRTVCDPDGGVGRRGRHARGERAGDHTRPDDGRARDRAGSRLWERELGGVDLVAVGIVLVWLMARVLSREEQIVEQRERLRAEAEARSNELASLLTVSRSVASTIEMQPLLDAILDALGKVVDYDGAVIFTLDAVQDTLLFAHMRGPASFRTDEARSMAYQVADLLPIWERLCRDEPIIVDDVRAETADGRLFRRLIRAEGVELKHGPYGFIRSLLWVPLVSRGRLIGMLSVANSRPDAYGPRSAELALAIGRQAAVALDNVELHERARQAAALEERERLARDLHDSVTQSLYGASLYAEAATRALADGDIEPAGANLREVRDTLQEALGEMRLLLFELRPPLLDELGLGGALKARLQAVESRAGLITDFQDHSDGQRLAQGIEQELFRVAQEALNNVLKHAHATRVELRLDVLPSVVAMAIADNGMGFTPEVSGTGGFGLNGMRQRIDGLGGTLRIDSTPGKGTRVQVEVPR